MNEHSWLSSTLGYISGAEESAFEKLVPVRIPLGWGLTKLSCHEILANEHSLPRSKLITGQRSARVCPHWSPFSIPLLESRALTSSAVVQAEMTKISIINAEILRMHLMQPVISSEAMDSILKTLRDWHAKLPRQMLLKNLAGQTLTDEVRRSIYHAHLLYLGALILVYRRIASEAARSVQVDRSTSSTKGVTVVLDQITRSRAQDGVVAARHSASILGLLLAEKGVFKRCWLVMYVNTISRSIPCDAPLTGRGKQLPSTYLLRCDPPRHCSKATPQARSGLLGRGHASRPGVS